MAEKGKIYKTPEFRMSYPTLFKPKQNTLNGKLEYSVEALFPPYEQMPPGDKKLFDELRAAVEQAKIDKWGPDKNKWPKDKETKQIKVRSPFKDQKMKEKEIDGKLVMPPGCVPGAAYLSLKSETLPGIVGPEPDPENPRQPRKITDPNEIYGGCYGRATVRVAAYEQKGNAGVSIYLNNIQKTRDGDAFGGGRSKPEDDFAPVGDTPAGATPGTAAGIFD